MKGVTSIGVERKNLLEEILGLGNVGVPSSFAKCLLSFKDRELGAVDGGDVVVHDLRKKLLADLEKLFPPPISVPEGRLEHLVENTVMSWVDSCMYHSSSSPISLYEDHHCSRDQIPTTTTQVSWQGIEFHV